MVQFLCLLHHTSKYSLNSDQNKSLYSTSSSTETRITCHSTSAFPSYKSILPEARRHGPPQERFLSQRPPPRTTRPQFPSHATTARRQRLRLRHRRDLPRHTPFITETSFQSRLLGPESLRSQTLQRQTSDAPGSDATSGHEPETSRCGHFA